jgi:cation-transporting ATPase E
VYTATRSELMHSIMRFVRIMTYVLIPVAAALFISQIRASPDISEAISGTIAGVVTMIPEGLVLLTSVAMAVAVVRLGRVQALVQELPAVEVLARVDVLCVDKTGTLTEPGMALRSLVPLVDDVDLPVVLGGLGAGERVANPTVSAIAAAHPADPEVQVAGGGRGRPGTRFGAGSDRCARAAGRPPRGGPRRRSAHSRGAPCRPPGDRPGPAP